MIGRAHTGAFRFAAELYRINNNNFLYHMQMNILNFMNMVLKNHIQR